MRCHFLRARSSGFSLLEVVVSVVLVAASLVVIVGMIPMGASAQRKSENIQAATLYACEMVEDAARPEYRPRGSDRFERDVAINGTTFHAVRVIYGVDATDAPHLYDVVVNVSWNPQPVPVELRLRVYHP